VPSLDDPGSHAAIDYGLYGVPETFFIARDGRVALKHVGPVTDQLLTTMIESLRTAQRTDSTGARTGSP
jgi:cytochrome c biogenesis protein CcmG, thiol:disulfide interchange protein DsbE